MSQESFKFLYNSKIIFGRKLIKHVDILWDNAWQYQSIRVIEMHDEVALNKFAAGTADLSVPFLEASARLLGIPLNDYCQGCAAGVNSAGVNVE